MAGLYSSTSPAEPRAKCCVVRAWSLPRFRSGSSGSQSCGSWFAEEILAVLLQEPSVMLGEAVFWLSERWALVYVNGSPSQSSGGLCCTMLELLGQC